MSEIYTKRVYEEPSEIDGYRVLVDRLWPRGLSKEKAQVDLWLKEVAPSHELRKWFHNGDGRWKEFQEKYKDELKDNVDAFRQLKELANEKGKITMLYGSRNTEENHALLLQKLIQEEMELK